jgi:anaerobic ribonucleoside-triphosphate reductase activating protein
MRYHNITHDDMLNGDGLRTVLWVSGCNHRCEGCHNPITWDPNGGLLFDEAAEDELFQELAKGYITGATFSGGDPLYPDNRAEITRLAKKIKEKFPNKNIWLYTGYLWEQVSNLEVLNYIDVMIDGRFVQELKNPQLHWRGSSNQRVIDVKKSIASGEVIAYEG